MQMPSSVKLSGVTSAQRRFGQPFHDSKNSLDARNRNQQGRREERRTGSDGECRKSLGVKFGGVRGWVRPNEGRNSAAREIETVRAVGRNSFARTGGN